MTNRYRVHANDTTLRRTTATAVVYHDRFEAEHLANLCNDEAMRRLGIVYFVKPELCQACTIGAHGVVTTTGPCPCPRVVAR